MRNVLPLQKSPNAQNVEEELVQLQERLRKGDALLNQESAWLDAADRAGGLPTAEYQEHQQRYDRMQALFIDLTERVVLLTAHCPHTQREFVRILSADASSLVYERCAVCHIRLGTWVSKDQQLKDIDPDSLLTVRDYLTPEEEQRLFAASR